MIVVPFVLAETIVIFVFPVSGSGLETRHPILRLEGRIFTLRHGRVACSFLGMLRQWKPLIVATVICLVGFYSTPAQSGPRAAARPSVASRVTGDVVDLTNVERTRRGQTPLRADQRLMRAAQIHAEQMARAGQMAHDLPGAAYPRSEDRLAAAKYHWQAYGENVAMGQSSAAHVLDSWMHSPGHRKNILNPVYTELGVGYAVDRAGRPYFVQVFARPSS